MSQPQLIVIDSQQGIDALLTDIKENEYVGYDCETDGLHFNCNVIGVSFCVSETRAYYIMHKRWDSASSSLVDVVDYAVVKAVVEALKGKSVICHNATFDCRVVLDYFKVNLIEDLHTDTMVLSSIVNENRRHGLKELAKTLFGEHQGDEQAEMKASVLANGGKLTKDQYEMFKCDPYIMGKYGAKDALLTFKLFNALVPELYEQGLEGFFYDDESMPLLKGSTFQLNTTGLRVDTQALTTLKKTLEAECIEAKAFIYQEITPLIKTKYPGNKKTNTFNIGSSQQLSWLMFGQMGLEFNTLTDAGKDVCLKLGIKKPYTATAKRDFIRGVQDASGMTSQPEAIVNGKTVKAKKFKEPWAYIACDKKALAKHSAKYKWIEKLLEYQRKTKILNTYIKGIETRTQYGIIRPSFLQHGTTSGRYSSRDPNFQNLPRDDKRIKACIIARPGKVFVGADYSQLEPRVFAYLSGDKRLIAAFDGQSDFYSVIGMGVYNKTDCTPQKEGSPEAFGIKYKKLRDLSKVIALASTYGATAHQLAPTTGKSINDTQQDIDNYFEEFPGVKEFMLKSHEMAKKDGFVKSIFGRPRRMPEAKKIKKLYGDMDHAEYPYEVRNMLNLAVNHRVQSTGASIVNRAAIRFNSLCIESGLSGVRLCIQVHDSLVAECLEADAEAVSLLLQESMENTVILEGISLEAQPKIGKNLAEV